LPIDTPNHSAFLGNAGLTEKKPWKYYLEIIDAAILNRIVLSLRQYISAGNNVPSLVFPKVHSRSKKFAAFCLFVRALPIDFALRGRKRKYIKSKTTTKLREKRTSIAAV